MSRIGSQIKRIREQKGMTHKQLGKAVGVNESFIRDLEAGKRIANDDLVKRISKALGQEINDLMLAIEKEAPVPEKAVVKKATLGVKPQENKVQEMWSDALDSVLKTVPVYEYDLTKVVGSRQLPVISNKVEGYAKDKVFYLKIQENDMMGFRIMKGDIAFAHAAHEVENNAICLVEYEGKRAIRQIKKLEGGKLLLISNDGRLSTETVSEKSLKVLAKLVKLEIKL
ncbi:S24 family peptidase [Pseudoclostridium thermosuccinogenes]|uniref:S24 family peptidase n=1 Tax=Clostridium thermosuccinogenes TaxID=84032 RepID=UPI002FDB1DFC